LGTLFNRYDIRKKKRIFFGFINSSLPVSLILNSNLMEWAWVGGEICHARWLEAAAFDEKKQLLVCMHATQDYSRMTEMQIKLRPPPPTPEYTANDTVTWQKCRLNSWPPSDPQKVKVCVHRHMCMYVQVLYVPSSTHTYMHTLVIFNSGNQQNIGQKWDNKRGHWYHRVFWYRDAPLFISIDKIHFSLPSVHVYITIVIYSLFVSYFQNIKKWIFTKSIFTV